MSDPRVKRFASLLVNYSVKVQPGEKVLLNGTIPTMPLVQETYREVVRAGGHPLLMINDDVFNEIMLREGSDEQLEYIPEVMKTIIETYDCMINIRGSNNTRAFSGVDPQREKISRTARSALMGTYMGRAARGELRWVSTMYPTQAHAQEADMSLADYEDFVFQACFVDREDPVAAWLEVSAMQQKLVDWLKGKDKVVVKGPNVDLTLSIAGRTFINSDATHNMPSGEIFTGPVEDSVNGWVKFTYPSIVGGREVEGIELRFEDGKIVDATAEKNEEFLHSMINTDPGASFLGEFAVGTNNGIQRFTKSILYDEKIGGTIHMAIGRGYPETGSTNISAVHWDMICDMRDGGKIWVDDELFYDSGKFVILE
ncbi:MAG: aminopeptidase [Anaerolineales bacterium]|nr:aminopeptidase [Anaerolineales bacterium]